MISKVDIEKIVERKAVPDSPVLSVYLDVDQSKASNLNRRFEVSLKDRLWSIEAQLDKEQLKSFSADAERVRQFVSGFEPRAKGLIIFCDDSENFLWAQAINAPVQSDARWSETAYILPLLEVLDEYERYGVILVDKAHARLFTVFMGEIEEHREVLATAEVRHIKTSGTDHIRSQTRFQRKADTHARWHLKHVAEMLDKILDFTRPDNLSLTETVVTMAGLSKFVIVDLSGSSVPAELQSILSQIKKPVLAFGNPYALFPDLADQTRVVTIEGDDSNLLGGLENNMPEVERLHAERIMQLAKRYANEDKERLL